ncbi:MAG: hypothetical protein M1366_04140 [Patescibacteria group bacterium]|nr:hypothetical protein [Patescibacteria group bacterium]
MIKPKIIIFKKMQPDISGTLSDPFISRATKIFLLIMIAFAILAIWKWKQMPPQLPLFYSLPRSTDTLGTKLQFFSLPLFSLVIFSLNTFIASFFYKKDKLISALLVGGACIISFLFFITYLKILLLVA